MSREIFFLRKFCCFRIFEVTTNMLIKVGNSSKASLKYRAGGLVIDSKTENNTICRH
jgi:hypothetical protein